MQGGLSLPMTIFESRLELCMVDFVEAGICEAMDEAESDCDSKDDPFADINEQ